MRKLALTFSMATAIPFSAFAADNELSGTYKLVVEQRQILDTGEIVPVRNPQGFINYSNDGRMIVLVVRNPRPKPESIEKTTDQERADLFRTMTAYAGTYRFDGEKSITLTCHGMKSGPGRRKSGPSKRTASASSTRRHRFIFTPTEK
jgi:hypothetical protein